MHVMPLTNCAINFLKTNFIFTVAPKIDRTNLNKKRVKAGQSFHFDVNITGEPPPTKVWSLKGSAIQAGDKVKITNEDYSTRIFVKQCRRSDNGTYTITATNEYGKDEAEVEVVVFGM